MIGTKSKPKYITCFSFVISKQDILEHGGSGLLSKYNSMYVMLSNVYKEVEWLPFMFDQTPRKYWDNIDNQKKFVEWAGKELKINEMSDWYHVSQEVEINKICGFSCLATAKNWVWGAVKTQVQLVAYSAIIRDLPQL